MARAFIGDMAYSLGATRYELAESAAAGRLCSSPDDLLAAGFARHHVCPPGDGSYDLARGATGQLPLDDGVDAIVYNTCLPQNGSIGDPAAWEATGDVKHLMEFPAGHLQADLGLDTAVVFGLTQQGCTGMLGALRLADALLASEPEWERVLCVSADRFPPGARYEQSYNVISDGAAACLVTARPAPGTRGLRLVATHQITNGGLHTASDDESVGTFFSYVPLLVRQTLARAGLTTADIDWVVPQNTNRHAWRIVAGLLGIDHERVWQRTLPDVAHAISADNIINLSSLLESAELRPGQRILLTMAGHGLNWQATVVEVTA